MTSNAVMIDPRDPVFISYRQSDGTPVTAELAWLLRAAGISVWRDKDDLPPGDTEARLVQAMGDGISGGVLVTTPEVANSTVVKTVESPALIALHAEHPVFALGIVNGIERAPGKLDYDAPDSVLGLAPKTLSGVDQHSTDRPGLITLTRKLLWHRVAHLRDSVAADDGTLRLSLQTRNSPQVYDRADSALEIRVRPSEHERLPSAAGLHDLADVLGLLPDAFTRSGAQRVRVSGGAHLSVAFAVGASLPSSRVGQMDVVDQQGGTWASDGEARLPATPRLQAVHEGSNPVLAHAGRQLVAVYLDLLPQRSDTAYTRYLEENEQRMAAWCHWTAEPGLLLDPADAGELAAEAAARIRELSNENENAEIHLLLRCPFPMALQLGRLTNTLRFVVYEWDDSDPVHDDDHRARYVPTMRCRASAGNGAIEEVLLS